MKKINTSPRVSAAAEYLATGIMTPESDAAMAKLEILFPPASTYACEQMGPAKALARVCRIAMEQGCWVHPDRRK